MVTMLTSCAPDVPTVEQGPQGVRGLAGPAGPRGAPGMDGLAGERGAMGLQGPPGKDAADGGYRPQQWVACARALDFVKADGSSGPDGTAETGLTYSWVRYTNGDVQASCTAMLGAVQAGSGEMYYPSITHGAAIAGCAAAADYPPVPAGGGSLGYWNFTRTKTGPLAEYRDEPTHWLTSRVYGFAENDCHVQTMDASGHWRDASLGDVL
jgi:hypothetical protein